MDRILSIEQRQDSARALFYQYADKETNTISRDAFETLHQSVIKTCSQACSSTSTSQLAALAFGITFEDFDEDGTCVTCSLIKLQYFLNNSNLHVYFFSLLYGGRRFHPFSQVMDI